MNYLEVKIEDLKFILSGSKGVYKISINNIPFLFFYNDKHAYDMFKWIVNTNLKKLTNDQQKI